MDLDRTEVSMMGYYFRQTADIDCSEIKHWPEKSFNGHYDGNGYTIKHIQIQDNWNHLFGTIEAESSVTSLKLEGLYLCRTVTDSGISCCSTNLSLINDKAINCSIQVCQSSQSLVAGSVTNCTITDCLVNLNIVMSTGKDIPIVGGIAQTLDHGSVIARCFVAGELKNSMSGDVNFSGIAGKCNASTIHQCAIGKVILSGSYVKWKSRIANEIDNASKLKNNASIDSNSGTDDVNGNDGKTIDSALFKQRYFQCTLSWNFETVWQWDNDSEMPKLRFSSVDYPEIKIKKIDILTQQIRANIWH